MEELMNKAQNGLANAMGGVTFPMTKDDVLSQARNKHLPPEILDDLSKIPDGTYNSISELISAAVKVSH